MTFCYNYFIIKLYGLITEVKKEEVFMPSGKILVVDDDQNICELLRLYIEKEGFEVEIAKDGRKALEAFDAYNPDLILLDKIGRASCRERV